MSMRGKLIEVAFEDRSVEAIVIDPNGMGEGKPTIGMGFGMTERHIGIPQNTLSTWSKVGNSDESETPTGQSIETHEIVFLMSPSKRKYSIHRITDESNREQLVIEASDWMELAADVLETPGKIRRATQVKIIQFLKWFAVKGFYASCYTRLFGAYTADDEARLTALQQQVHDLEELAADLFAQTALLEHQNSTLLYRLDALGEPEEEEPINWSFDWQVDVEEESDRA